MGPGRNYLGERIERSRQKKKSSVRSGPSSVNSFERIMRVDPNLLAGVRARVASREYDATLRGSLEQMRRRLLAWQPGSL